MVPRSELISIDRAITKVAGGQCVHRRVVVTYSTSSETLADFLLAIEANTCSLRRVSTKTHSNHMNLNFAKLMFGGLIVVSATWTTIGCKDGQSSSTSPAACVTYIEPVMNQEDEKNRTPGFNSTTLFGGLWNEKTVFLIWTAGEYSDSYISTTGEPGAYSGYLLPPGADRMDWKCVTTSQGKSGKLTLGDENYDLANGGVFLVATSSGKVSVKQVKQDLSQIRSGAEGFEDWCRQGGFKKWFNSVPEIKEFFGQSDDGI